MAAVSAVSKTETEKGHTSLAWLGTCTDSAARIDTALLLDPGLTIDREHDRHHTPTIRLNSCVSFYAYL